MIVEWNLSTQCHAATMLPNRVIITVHVYMDDKRRVASLKCIILVNIIIKVCEHKDEHDKFSGLVFGCILS